MYILLYIPNFEWKYSAMHLKYFTARLWNHLIYSPTILAVALIVFLIVWVSHAIFCALSHVSFLFLLFFLLYSSSQAGLFTTKRQRESPINLVANHALDSSVDLCLCPSVCICLFYLLTVISMSFVNTQSFSSGQFHKCSSLDFLTKHLLS